MPHIFQNTNTVVLTLAELVPAHFTYDALRMQLKRAEARGYGIRRVMLGGNGRQLLIDYDTLPRKVRECFKDPRVAEHPLEPFYRTDPEAVVFFGDFKYSNGLYLADEVQERYVLNASVLNAAMDLKVARERERLSKMGSLKGIISSLCADVSSFNELLYKRYSTRHSLPGNERRFGEKLNEYMREGYPSLISKNLGNRNAATTNDATVQLLNNIFAEPSYKPSYSEVARQYESFLSGYSEVVKGKTGEVYDPADFKKLSKSTIYNYLSTWGSRIATHATRSADNQKYMGRYKPAFSFEQPKYAGSLLSVDDRQPPFKYSGNERVWFYLAEDVASQAITCWVHGKTKEGLIMEFYRQLVRNYHEWGLHLPAELECERSLNWSFRDTFLKEGAMFEYVRIEANNARGKAIESQVNRQLRYSFEKMEEGFQGRPFARDESNQPSPTRDSIDRSYAQIVEMALGKIEEFNNSPHPREAGLSKWEYFLNNQNPNLKPTNYRAFIRHLGYHTETSVNAGNIRLNNNLYLLGVDGEMVFGEALINLMKQVEGKEVDVYWLDANDGAMMCAYVYLRGQDRLICEAVPKPRPQRARAERTDVDYELHERYSKYVATVNGYGNNQRKALDRVVVIKTDKELLNQPKTLFKISGNGTSASLHQEADPINTTSKDFEVINGVEVLPAAPDELETILNNDITPVKRSLLDRF